MKKDTEGETPQKDHQDIEKIITEFSVIDDKNLSRMIFIALFALAIMTAFHIFLGLNSHGDFDILYISAGVAIITFIFVSLELFQRFPKALLAVWKRKIICFPEKAVLDSSSSNKNGYQMSKYLERTSLSLKNQIGILFGFIGLGVSAWTIWLLDQSWITNVHEYFRDIPLELLIVLVLRTIFLFSGFICGMITWRIFIISKQISELGKNFDFDMPIDHPDGCGGLRPIGDLSLGIAYCLGPFLILIGSWLVFVNTLDLRYLRLLPTNINRLISMLQISIFPFVSFGFLAFFLPLISVHNSMLQAKEKIQATLDSISEQINNTGQELLNNAVNLTPKDGIVLEERLDFLKRSYNRFNSIPTWPFRVDHLLRLVSAQIIPIIGLLSTLVNFIHEFTK